MMLVSLIPWELMRFTLLLTPVINLLPLLTLNFLADTRAVYGSIPVSESASPPPYGRYSSYHSCDREPQNTNSAATPGSNGFKIKIIGNPEKYVPGEMYTVVLQGDQRISKSSTSIQKFIEFMLVVEPRDSTTPNPSSTGAPQMPDVGTFQLYGDSLSKLSEHCPNSIVQTSSIPKVEISVMWIAPAPGSGCVVFKAMVVERKDVWYIDSQELIKILCEKESDSNDEQPEVVIQCCACDEAKYEVTFEGLWSKYTHPKDFPTNFWLTHFSDIIGASHSADFKMWEYGGYASEGVKQVAEMGVTKKLESELKAVSNKIRTIIKARGLWHPNLNGKTFAVFRVDSKHHLMSLISMLGPSPDWIVGVAGLELCLKNCSWTSEKVMNLYLWDAGTDSGITYLSPKQPTIPVDRIKRIQSNSPNHPESPFFDPNGGQMKPIARLTVSRQRIYEKPCGEDSDDHSDNHIGNRYGSENEDDTRRVETSADCKVTEWTEFAPCTATCGQGIRMRTRNFDNKQKAQQIGCTTTIIEKENCDAECVGEVSCATASWTEWQECSATCGKGFRSRTRKFMHRMARKVCGHIELVEKEPCVGPVSKCDETEEIDPKCSVMPWGEWSPCTASCGKGIRVRARFYNNARLSQNICNVELIQQSQCVADKTDCAVDLNQAKDLCLQNKDSGPCRGYFPRYYYDATKGKCVQFVYGGCRGNKNNFEHYDDCKRMCEDMLRNFVQTSLPPSTIAYAYPMKDTYVHLEKGLVCAPIGSLTSLSSGNSHSSSLSAAAAALHPSNTALVPISDHKDQPIIDCVLTPWGSWTPCSKTCGTAARKERRRMIKLNPSNGGAPCPKKLVQRRRCKENPQCDDSITSTNTRMANAKNANSDAESKPIVVNCIMSIWGEWSPCSKTCGVIGIQMRSRTVIQKPRYGGAICASSVDRRYCQSLEPCVTKKWSPKNVTDNVIN